MPDIQAQTADGVTHSFPDGTPPEVVDRAIKQYVTSTKPGPEAQALAHPPIATSIPSTLARPAMPGVSSRFAGPQSVALSPGERASRDEPMEVAKQVAPMALSAPFMGAPVAEAIGAGSLEPLAPLARGLLKSAAGAEIGRMGGGALGSMFNGLSPNAGKTGGEIGAAVGGLAGPFISGETFSKLPLGLGRFVATNEETAAARAEMKLTQRNADIAAGLRKPAPAAISVDPNTMTPSEDDIASTVAKSKGRLVLSPEEVRTRERMAPIWKQRASERGMIFAGGGVPEEGRSVPRMPTVTSISEYGGARLDAGLDPATVTAPPSQGVVSNVATSPGPKKLIEGVQ